MADSPVLKAIAILKHLAASGTPIGVQQIASDVDLNVSTVHRLLQLMVRDGMVSYDSAGRTYAIGTECIRFATHVLGSNSLIGRVRPHIAKLAAELKETCAFTLYEPKTASKIVALVERGSHALGYDFDVGSRDGIHAGASGKPILAYLPDAEIDKILRRRLPKLTEFTVVDPDELRKQIRQIRKNHYALSRGERIPGAGVGVGAPVFGAHRRVIGSVVVTIPDFRWRKSRLNHVAKLVIATAKKISRITDDGLLPTGNGHE
jgi:DNA-binding IclR family transcriptional regulator